MRRAPTLAAAVLAFLLDAAVAACGGDDSPGQSAEQQPSEQQPAGETESVHHIHGLGVDPSNGTLYVATHTGLFKAVAASRLRHSHNSNHQSLHPERVLLLERQSGVARTA
jgi:hypothetical protein